MNDRASASVGFRFLLALVLGIAVSGCAVFRSEKGEIVYAASADLAVRATPFATSKAIGTLALHEAVTRTQVERGFGHVVARRGDLEGWVDNGELISQLPGRGEPKRP